MTPDTGFYYYVAYTVAALLYGGYMASLWWRAKNLRK